MYTVNGCQPNNTDKFLQPAEICFFEGNKIYIKKERKKKGSLKITAYSYLLVDPVTLYTNV